MSHPTMPPPAPASVAFPGLGSRRWFSRP